MKPKFTSDEIRVIDWKTVKVEDIDFDRMPVFTPGLFKYPILIIAVMHHCNLDILQRLIDFTKKNEVSINYVTQYGASALFAAFRTYKPNNGTGIIEMLLRNGADPDIQNKRGQNPTTLINQRVNQKVKDNLLQILADARSNRNGK